MNLENHFENRKDDPCGSVKKPLVARLAAGWRRGYAADCKSVNPSRDILKEYHDDIRENSHKPAFENHPGHSANGPGTLTTNDPGVFDWPSMSDDDDMFPSGWWIVPFATIGTILTGWLLGWAWTCVKIGEVAPLW